MANGENGAAGVRQTRLAVIKDTVEIDEVIQPDDRITIEDCWGFVLLEIPRGTFGGLTSGQIFDQAKALADKSTPYGIERITWKHAYEGNDCFLRFTVQSWKLVPQAAVQSC